MEGRQGTTVCNRVPSPLCLCRCTAARVAVPETVVSETKELGFSMLSFELRRRRLRCSLSGATLAGDVASCYEVICENSTQQQQETSAKQREKFWGQANWPRVTVDCPYFLSDCSIPFFHFGVLPHLYDLFRDVTAPLFYFLGSFSPNPVSVDVFLCKAFGNTVQKGLSKTCQLNGWTIVP